MTPFGLELELLRLRTVWWRLILYLVHGFLRCALFFAMLPYGTSELPWSRQLYRSLFPRPSHDARSRILAFFRARKADFSYSPVTGPRLRFSGSGSS